MDSLDPFTGHLRTIAEVARRWTPRLISITPRVVEGRTVVYVRMDTRTSHLFVALIARMEAFCKREGLPPDYQFSFDTPAPGLPPPSPSVDALPSAWPPDDP